MYINDISIVYYLLFGILGFIVGKFTAWANVQYVNEQGLSIKKFWKEKNQVFEKQYIIMFIIAVIYIALLYINGIGESFIKNLNLVKYLILIPMLVSTFLIDLKHRIIPNRLNMYIFEVGILFAFIYGIYNISLAKDMFLGMIVGGGIFIAITLLGGLIAGKEAMGLGDVKFMGAVGLYFGVTSITEISVLAFFIAAIISIAILIIRLVKKKQDEYVPFGPFLVVATVFVMFAGDGVVFHYFMLFCNMLSSKLLGIL